VVEAENPALYWPSDIDGIGFTRALDDPTGKLVMYVDSREELKPTELQEPPRAAHILYHRKRGRLSEFPPSHRRNASTWFQGHPVPSANSRQLAEHAAQAAHSTSSSVFTKREAVDPCNLSVLELNRFIKNSCHGGVDGEVLPDTFNNQLSNTNGWWHGEKTEAGSLPEWHIEHMLDVGCQSLSKFKGLLSGEMGLQAMVSATLWWTERSLEEALKRNATSEPNADLAKLSRDIKVLNLASCTLWQQILRLNQKIYLLMRYVLSTGPPLI